jgi:hypothetical protein
MRSTFGILGSNKLKFEKTLPSGESSQLRRRFNVRSKIRPGDQEAGQATVDEIRLKVLTGLNAVPKTAN